MRNLILSAPHSRTMLLCLSVLAFHSECSAQARGEPLPEEVLRYLDSRSSILGWADLSKIDFDALGQFLQQLNGSEFSIAEAKAVSTALVKLGVGRIYWISDLSGITQGPKAVLMPVTADKQDAVAAILRALMPGDVIPENGVILAGEAGAVARLKGERSGAASQDLLAAAKQVSHPHALVIATPVPAVLPVVSVLPTLAGGEPERVAKAAEYLVSLRSVTLSGQLPPSEGEVQILTRSKDTAAGLSSLANQWIMEQFPDTAKDITLTAEGEHIRLLIHKSEQTLSIVTMLRQLLHGNSRPESVNSLKHIALAMHNFHDVYTHFPPQALADADGRRLLSWRVLILPYLDQMALYSEFHLDEPWDSEHNLKLVAKMPEIYRSKSVPGSPGTPGKTRFTTLLAKDSVFGRTGAGVKLQEISDGSSNTLMVIEADPDRAVIWTKPEDCLIDENNPLSFLSGSATQPFVACLCDGSVRTFSRKMSPVVFRALCSMNGGEVIDWNVVE